MRKLLFLPLTILLLYGQLMAQNRTITGRITDTQNAGVENASISVKGTTIGTVSTVDGNFTLSVPANATTLIVSSVGFGNQEFAINNRTTLNLSLTNATSSLDEIVVVGYQQRKKIDEAGAVSTVRAADIENKPYASLDKALQGRAAGVLVQSNNGIPGGSINVRIRGTGSFQAGTQPLYIVDGVRMNTRNDASFTQSNPLSFLNPNDIESIDILKDASASIYGASAANGVVIITTKKGRSGKTKFNFNTYVGQSRPIKKLDVLNTQEYVQLRVEAQGNANITRTPLQNKNIVLGELRQANTYTDEKSADSAIAALPTTDWQDAVFRTGKVQNYELSASGGTDKTTFRISTSYAKQEAIVTKADFTRGTLKFDINNKATEKLTIGTSFNISTANQTVPFATDGSFLGSPAFSASLIIPANPIYNSDGTFFGISPNNLAGSLNQNIVAVNEYNSGYNRTNQAVGNISLNYKFTDWLNLKSFYGIDYRLVQGQNYRDPRTPDGFNRRGIETVQSNWNTNFLTYQTLNFNRTFNVKHKVDALMGVEYKRENNESISATAENFPSYQFRTINSAAIPTSTGGFFSGFRTMGYFTSANYSMDGRYIINGILRYDYSSRFGENNRWGLFPAIKAAWNINRENFMSGQDLFSQLRLRASWGQSGNDQVGNFDALGLYGSGTVYNGAAGINFSQLANPNLKWEVNESSNLGLDFALFKSRITGTVEVYRKLTKDALLNLPVQQTSGFSSYSANVGRLKNEGIELTLGGDILRSKNPDGIKWTTNFVFAYNKNKVLELYSGLQELPGDPSTRVGRSIGSIFTQQYAGVNPATGRPMWLDTLGNLTYQVQARDRVYIGDTQPEYSGGLNNSISFKGFTLDAFFQYEYGRLASDGQINFLIENLSRFNQLQVLYDKRFTTPGQITSFPRQNINGSESKGSGGLTGSRPFFKADYVRLKNVTVSYSVPASVYNKLKLNSAQFYVSGTNLYTFSDTYSYDVEFFGSATGIIPQSKIFTVGLQVGF